MPTDDIAADEIDKSSWKVLVVRWLFNQGASTTLLSCLLLFLGYLSDFAFRVAIPQHIQMITKDTKDTLEKVTGEQNKAIKELGENHERSIQAIITRDAKQHQDMYELIRDMNGINKSRPFGYRPPGTTLPSGSSLEEGSAS